MDSTYREASLAEGGSEIAEDPSDASLGHYRTAAVFLSTFDDAPTERTTAGTTRPCNNHGVDIDEVTTYGGGEH
jgi:hypothetical protein